MALYDTRFGLPQAVADYLNQGLPDIYQNIYNPPPATIGPITTMPVESTPLVDPLYPQTGGNAEGFSVYNPDPNRTRTSDQYSPYNYRQAAERNLIGTMGGALTGTQIPNTSTEVAKLMDMYPDYYQGKQLTGIPGAIQGYMKNSLAGQLLGKAASGIESLLPVNQRAILENEALGAGIRLDDIGRVVSDGGNINTAENIMAGYNLAKITPETIQKRRDVINENMKDPEQKKAKLDALDEFEEKMFGETGIKTKADIVFDDKSLAKDPTYKNIDQLIKEGLLEGDDDDDEYEFDPTDPRNFFKIDPVSRKSAIDQEAANRNVQREIARRNAAAKTRASSIAQEAANRDAARQAAKTRASSIAQEAANRDAARKKSSGPSYSGMSSIGSGGGGGGIGSSYGGAASPGSKGPGGSDEMGSF